MPFGATFVLLFVLYVSLWSVRYLLTGGWVYHFLCFISSSRSWSPFPCKYTCHGFCVHVLLCQQCFFVLLSLSLFFLFLLICFISVGSKMPDMDVKAKKTPKKTTLHQKTESNVILTIFLELHKRGKVCYIFATFDYHIRFGISKI